jgi:hypothetical protein
MKTVQKRPTPPAKLRAIVDLLRAGWTREEIMRKERICRRTYYYRLAEIRRIESAPPAADDDD